MSTYTPFAAESGHWYDQHGNPAYEVPKKSARKKCPECTGSLKGAEAKARTAACGVCDAEGYVYPELRPTTLTDARQMGLARSVTGIIRVMASPGLERYKLRQLAEAAYTAPKDIATLPFDQWLEKVEADAKEHARQASAKGTDIHATLERGFRGEDLDGYRYAEWFTVAREAIGAKLGHLPAFEAERSFTNVEGGYGCKVDLCAAGIDDRPAFVGDYKTKDFKRDPLGNPTDEGLDLTDDHLMQLAANAVAAGLRGARGFIVFVDREAPLAVVRVATVEQMERGWRMFRACLILSRMADEYVPAWAARVEGWA